MESKFVWTKWSWSQCQSCGWKIAHEHQHRKVLSKNQPTLPLSNRENEVQRGKVTYWLSQSRLKCEIWDWNQSCLMPRLLSFSLPDFFFIHSIGSQLLPSSCVGQVPRIQQSGRHMNTHVYLSDSQLLVAGEGGRGQWDLEEYLAWSSSETFFFLLCSEAVISSCEVREMSQHSLSLK